MAAAAVGDSTEGSASSAVGAPSQTALTLGRRQRSCGDSLDQNKQLPQSTGSWLCFLAGVERSHGGHAEVEKKVGGSHQRRLLRPTKLVTWAWSRHVEGQPDGKEQKQERA
ncbi:hypothetical protein MRX96_002047 [Rhipicephalus microplus]